MYQPHPVVPSSQPTTGREVKVCLLRRPACPANWSVRIRWLRVLTIFEGLIFTLFEVRFPFRFPRAVGENGKRKWVWDSRSAVAGGCAYDREIKVG
jgi:hypothetical protein